MSITNAFNLISNMNFFMGSIHGRPLSLLWLSSPSSINFHICLNTAVSSLPCMASLPGVTFERVFAEKLRSRLKMAGSNLARLCSGNILGHSHSGMSRQNSAAVSSKATLSMVALSRSTFADWLPFFRTCNQIIWRTCKFGHWLIEITKSLIVKPKSIASHTRKAAETPMITWETMMSRRTNKQKFRTVRKTRWVLSLL